jgi:HEAT repeat protein
MQQNNLEQRPLEDLLSLLNHREMEVRWMAARVLSEHGADAVEPLLSRLYDDDSGVRVLSIWALGRIGDCRALVPISRTIHDEDALISMASEGALSRMLRCKTIH